MAGKPELEESLAIIESSAKDLIDSIITLISESTSAYSRLLQKIAEGSPDIQPEVDRIKLLSQNLNDTNVKVISAIAQAKVEGV